MKIDSYKAKLRKQNVFIVHKQNQTFYVKSYLYLAPKMFNSIPVFQQILKTKTMFSNKVKNWLLKQELSCQ